MKKYKTPNGQIVDESVLRQKYGNEFDTLVSNGTFSVYEEAAVATKTNSKSVYETPNGTLVQEEVLTEKYGNDFATLVGNGTLKKKVGTQEPFGGIGGTVGTSKVQSDLPVSKNQVSNNEYRKNLFDLGLELNEKRAANTVSAISEILKGVEITDEAIPDNIIDKKGYRLALQQRLLDKAPVDLDLQVLASATNKPIEAIEAYTKGRDGKGIMIEFDTVKKTKAVELENLITKANSDLGLVDTFDAVFTTPETASLYIDKIESAYKQKAEKDAENYTTGNKAVFLDETMAGIELAAIQTGMNDIKNAADQTVSKIKSIIGQDILTKIENDDSLTYDQKVKKAGSLIYGQERENILAAKSKRLLKDSFGSFDLLNQLGSIFRDETEEKQNLNSVNAIVESKLNNSIKQKIIYDQAVLNETLQEAMEKAEKGTLTDAEKASYQATVEKLKSSIEAKQKEYKSPQQLQKEYPILLKQSLISDINEFNAIKSGNVKGYEDGGYKGIALEEHLKAQGYDMDSQVVKDVISDAKEGVGVKDYSFFGEPVKAIKEVFTSSAKSLGDIVGIRDDVTVLSEKKASELFPATVGNLDDYQLTTAASTAQNIFNTTGQVIGQALMQVGTAGIGRIAGLSKVAAANTGFWSSGALTSYDNAYKDSFDFIDGNAGRTAYAGLIALSNAASEKIFPEAKLFNIPGVKSSFSELASKLSTGELTDKLANQLLTKAKNAFVDYGVKYAKNISKETLEETATSLFESGARFIFGDPNIDVETAIANAKNTAIQTAIGTVLIGGMGAHKDVQAEKNIAPVSVIYNAAVYKDEAMDALNIGFKEGLYDEQELNKKISILNTAEVGLSELKKAEQVFGRELSRSQKELFVANATAQKLLIEEKKGIEEAAVTSKIDEKLSNLKNQQTHLLENKVQFDDFGNVITPVTETVTPTVESAVIEINGKTYEGKNHAEAILKAKDAGEDITQVDRQAEGKFKLSDGTIIDRAEAKTRFGQDRSELLIPQDESANQANKDYEAVTEPVKDINAPDMVGEPENISKPIELNVEDAVSSNVVENAVSDIPVMDRIKSIQDDGAKFKTENEKHFTKAGGLRKSAPKEVVAKYNEFMDRYAELQKEFLDEKLRPFETGSKKNKEESRLATEKINQEWEQTQKDLAQEYHLTENEIQENAIDEKLRLNQELTSDELSYVNENYYKPKGYEFDINGDFIKSKKSSQKENNSQTIKTKSNENEESNNQDGGQQQGGENSNQQAGNAIPDSENQKRQQKEVAEDEGSASEGGAEPLAKKAGKFEEKARKLADKIMAANVVPDWLKIDDPNVKKSGVGADEIKKALANATIKMGQLLDKGVEFAEAVKEAVQGLVDLMGENNRQQIEEGFTKEYENSFGKIPPTDNTGENDINGDDDFIKNFTITLAEKKAVNESLKTDLAAGYSNDVLEQDDMVDSLELDVAVNELNQLIGAAKNKFGEQVIDYAKGLYNHFKNLKDDISKLGVMVQLKNDLDNERKLLDDNIQELKRVDPTTPEISSLTDEREQIVKQLRTIADYIDKQGGEASKKFAILRLTKRLRGVAVAKRSKSSIVGKETEQKANEVEQALEEPIDNDVADNEDADDTPVEFETKTKGMRKTASSDLVKKAKASVSRMKDIKGKLANLGKKFNEIEEAAKKLC